MSVFRGQREENSKQITDDSYCVLGFDFDQIVVVLVLENCNLVKHHSIRTRGRGRRRGRLRDNLAIPADQRLRVSVTSFKQVIDWIYESYLFNDNHENPKHQKPNPFFLNQLGLTLTLPCSACQSAFIQLFPVLLSFKLH